MRVRDYSTFLAGMGKRLYGNSPRQPRLLLEL